MDLAVYTHVVVLKAQVATLNSALFLMEDTLFSGSLHHLLPVHQVLLFSSVTLTDVPVPCLG